MERNSLVRNVLSAVRRTYKSWPCSRRCGTLSYMYVLALASSAQCVEIGSGRHSGALESE